MTGLSKPAPRSFLFLLLALLLVAVVFDLTRRDSFLRDIVSGWGGDPPTAGERLRDDAESLLPRSRP